MLETSGAEAADVILDRFIEGLFRLLQDQHRTHVVEMDLTLAQAQALNLLNAAPLTTSKLAEALGISPPAVSQLTDRLSRKQLIERQAVHGDRRTVIVAVTEKGGRIIDGFRRRRNEIFAQTLTKLGDEERTEVLNALSKIAAVIQGNEVVGLLRVNAPPRLPADQLNRRTPPQAPEASKKVGHIPVSAPTRRMRIEWD
jgi:DNA-binding MarR family transcriptional regulator